MSKLIDEYVYLTNTPTQNKLESEETRAKVQFLLENTLNEDLQMHVQKGVDCHNACIQTAVYCMQKGPDYSQKQNIKTLLYCAEICEINADSLLSGSQMADQTSTVCAEIADQCAILCGQFSDSVLRNCGQICKSYADSCRGAV